MAMAITENFLKEHVQFSEEIPAMMIQLTDTIDPPPLLVMDARPGRNSTPRVLDRSVTDSDAGAKRVSFTLLSSRGTPMRGELKVQGPTGQGFFLVLDQDQNCVLTCKLSRLHATLFSRAPNMRAVLEHLLTELEADDDGTRYASEIRMIKDELARSPPLPE
jgi:hypothetical protein